MFACGHIKCVIPIEHRRTIIAYVQFQYSGQVNEVLGRRFSALVNRKSVILKNDLLIPQPSKLNQIKKDP